MAFSIFLSITVIAMISFIVTKKNLHLFEIMFIWMIAIIIDHNFMTVVAANLGMYEFAHNPSRYWALSLVRIILFPLLIVWYFDKTAARKHTKWICLPFGIGLLIGLEYLCDVLNVFNHTHWKLWWSLIEWFIVFLVLNYAWLWYRNTLRREMN